jgi:transglutaminase-like putative cysteine protease
MRIKIRHEIVQRFDPSARRVIEALRLTPRSHEGQHVLEWRIDVEADCRLRRAEDAFGNLADMFSLQAPPSELRLVAEGVVETFDFAGVVRGALERFPPDLFLRDTALTAPDAALRALADAARGADLIERLHALMRLVRDRLEQPAAEESAPGGLVASSLDVTPAAQALERGRGSARDLAHVFIAAARCMGAPARIVSGYAALDAPGGGQGACEGAAHAWAEAHVEGVGWIGFDSAQVICPQERHVRIACGLDWLDAAPVRASSQGVIVQEARVELRPSAVQRQSQQ